MELASIFLSKCIRLRRFGPDLISFLSYGSFPGYSSDMRYWSSAGSAMASLTVSIEDVKGV
jgi:hypothetical protein